MKGSEELEKDPERILDEKRHSGGGCDAGTLYAWKPIINSCESWFLKFTQKINNYEESVRRTLPLF